MFKLKILLLLLLFIPTATIYAEKIERADVTKIILLIEKKLKEIKSDFVKATLLKDEIKAVENAIFNSRTFLQKKKLQRAYYTIKIAEKYFDKMKVIQELNQAKVKFDTTKKQLTAKKENKDKKE